MEHFECSVENHWNKNGHVLYGAGANETFREKINPRDMPHTE